MFSEGEETQNEAIHRVRDDPLLMVGFLTASADKASAMVYCLQVDFPANCIVRPGVVLRSPVPRGAVRLGTPMNRVGPGGSGRQALSHHAASLAGIDRDG